MVIPITRAILQHLNNPLILHCAGYNNFFREDYIPQGSGDLVFRYFLPTFLIYRLI
jgi:hypothetical protein